jgi:hypothetical protein
MAWLRGGMMDEPVRDLIRPPQLRRRSKGWHATRDARDLQVVRAFFAGFAGQGPFQRSDHAIALAGNTLLAREQH